LFAVIIYVVKLFKLVKLK